MSLKTEICFDINSEYWNDALKREEHATAFQVADWFEPNKRMDDARQFFILVKDSSDEIVGQLTGVIGLGGSSMYKSSLNNFIFKKLNLGNKIVWHHGPIIHNKKLRYDITKEILKRVDELLTKYDIDYVHGTSIPTLQPANEEIFESFGYSITPWSTYILDLKKDQKNLRGSLDKKIRYELRKSEKNNLSFQLASSRHELDEFARFKHKLRGNPSPDLLPEDVRDHNWKIWYEGNIKKLFLVRFKDELIGAISISEFNGNLYQAAVVNTKKEIGGGTFLTWNVIKWGSENAKSKFDFGGVNPNPSSNKEKGIDFFKSKWGGEKFSQDIFIKICNKNKMKIAKIIDNPRLLKKLFS